MLGNTIFRLRTMGGKKKTFFCSSFPMHLLKMKEMGMKLFLSADISSKDI